MLIVTQAQSQTAILLMNTVLKVKIFFNINKFGNLNLEDLEWIYKLKLIKRNSSFVDSIFQALLIAEGILHLLVQNVLKDMVLPGAMENVFGSKTNASVLTV